MLNKENKSKLQKYEKGTNILVVLIYILSFIFFVCLTFWLFKIGYNWYVEETFYSLLKFNTEFFKYNGYVVETIGLICGVLSLIAIYIKKHIQSHV